MTVQDLGRAMKTDREAIGLKQEDVNAAAGGGISRPLWSRLENGHDGNYRTSTFTAIDRALKWKPGTARSYYDTGAPLPTPPAATGEAADVAALVARLEAENAALRERLDALAAQLDRPALPTRQARRPAER